MSKYVVWRLLMVYVAVFWIAFFAMVIYIYAYEIMKWVNPKDEMPGRYKVILLVIRYPLKDRPLTITTGVYTGEQYGWYADFNGKYLDTDQIKYWAPIASLPKDY